MADKKKDDLTCTATFNTQGGLEATLKKGDKVIATGKDFSRDGILPDSWGPPPLSKDWKGTGDSYTNNPGKYDAKWKEDGFKINGETQTCDVVTVDGGQVPNAHYKNVPLKVDPALKPPGQ